MQEFNKQDIVYLFKQITIWYDDKLHVISTAKPQIKWLVKNYVITNINRFSLMKKKTKKINSIRNRNKEVEGDMKFTIK